MRADFLLADVMSPKRRTDTDSSAANVNVVVDHREEKDPPPQPIAIGSVFDRYWITNSMSGLYHIRISDGKKRRYFWTLVRLSLLSQDPSVIV